MKADYWLNRYTQAAQGLANTPQKKLQELTQPGVMTNRKWTPPPPPTSTAAKGGSSSSDSADWIRKRIGSTATGPLTPEERTQYKQYMDGKMAASTRKRIGSTATGPLTPEENAKYSQYIDDKMADITRKRIGSTATGPLTPEENAKYGRYMEDKMANAAEERAKKKPSPPSTSRGKLGASVIAPAAWAFGSLADSAYDPTLGQPTYIRDAEEARGMERFAENAEKRDWMESMTPQQKADYLAKFRNK